MPRLIDRRFVVGRGISSIVPYSEAMDISSAVAAPYSTQSYTLPDITYLIPLLVLSDNEKMVNHIGSGQYEVGMVLDTTSILLWLKYEFSIYAGME